MHDAHKNNYIGTEHLLKKFPELGSLPDEENVISCYKDTGERQKLRHWSRGHLFIVHPCGHIDVWRPIYR